MARVVTVEITGVDAVKRALGAAFAKADREIALAVTDLASDLREEVTMSIARGAKTGRVYRRGGVVHRASAPGQSPASDTGTLVNSIYVEPDGPARVVVGSRLAYAAYLEFGTQNIAPRPAWVPAVEKLRPEFMAQIEAVLARAMNASR